MAQALIERVKGILLSPKTEWDKIDTETVEPQSVITGYVLPLVAIAAIAGLIGMSIFGVKVLGVSYKAPFFGALTGAVVQIAFGVAFVFVFAFIINSLAPTFGAAKNWGQAFKVAAYAPTAAWVAGMLAIIPMLGVLGVVGGLYSLYLLFVGMPKLMKPPAEKATTYTIVSIVVAIIASIILGAIAGMFMPKPGIGTYSGNNTSTSEFERRADALEKASESGDLGAIMDAATGMLGGDANAPLVEAASLRNLAPEKLNGLNRQSLDVESLSVPIKMVTMTARYQNERNSNDENQQITLKITNSPMISAVVGISGIAGAEYDRSSDDGYERLTRKGGGMVIEEWRKSSKSGRYGRLVAEMFMVEAEGSGVDMKDLKDAVHDISERKLKNLPKAE